MVFWGDFFGVKVSVPPFTLFKRHLSLWFTYINRNPQKNIGNLLSPLNPLTMAFSKTKINLASL